LLQLQDAGLVGGVGGFTTQKFEVPPVGPALIRHKGQLICFEGSPGEKIALGGCYLTQVGREVQTLLDASGWREGTMRAIEHLKKSNLTKIYRGAIVNAGTGQAVLPIETLWQKESA